MEKAARRLATGRFLCFLCGTHRDLFSFFLRSHRDFLPASSLGETVLDAIFLMASAALWLLMVAMAWGVDALQRKGVRSA
ncbi:hypothetical protein [Ramlibacter aquaticus]|uniref:hypothetical protein n=1 Tax=Ramlibacter aquaticus TaxID=2780094 RepID=UPI00187D1AB5|nr:hypothetical protein [Ramlibacter aquaticus]